MFIAANESAHVINLVDGVAGRTNPEVSCAGVFFAESGRVRRVPGCAKMQFFDALGIFGRLHHLQPFFAANISRTHFAFFLKV